MISFTEAIKVDLTNNKPGRLNYSCLLTLCTLVVIITCQVYQIPAMEYSAFLVLFISKEEKLSALITCLILLLAIIFSVSLAMLIYVFSAGEPALRIPLMLIVVFLCMGLSQIPKLGRIAFIAGFSTTLCLIVIDEIPPFVPFMATTELLTRSVLWLWVAAFLPLLVVSTANLYLGENPVILFQHELEARLIYITQLLSHFPLLTKPKLLNRFESDSLEDAMNYLKMSALYQKKFKLREKIYERMLAQVIKLLFLTREWNRLLRKQAKITLLSSSHSLLEISQVLQYQALFSAPPIPNNQTKELKSTSDNLLLSCITHRVNSLIQLSNLPSPQYPEKNNKVKKQYVALLNQKYVRHGLKASLAVFIAYFTYSMLDWPSIRTCMITCFFVALGTQGETNHKMLLRISGALLGGILGQLSILFIIPHITSIFSFCIMLTGPIFIASWLVTSSERLSYAGLQLALAFFVSIFNGFGPSTDLTLARDRVIGILFGNVIVYVVFTCIWPVRTMEKVRQNFAELLETLAKLLSTVIRVPENDDQPDQLVFAINEACWQSKRALFFSQFEGQQKPIQRRAMKCFIRLRHLIASLFVLEDMYEIAQLPLVKQEQELYLGSVIQWLNTWAEQVKINQSARISLPNYIPLKRQLDIAATNLSIPSGYVEWYNDFNHRIQVLHQQLQKMLVLQHNPLNFVKRITT